MPLRFSILGALFVAAITAAPTASALTWLPTRVLVDRVEHGLSSPAGARPLSEYRRVYWGKYDPSGDPLLFGQFEHSDRPGVEIINGRERRVVRDGGCSYLDLIYDVKADRVIAFHCQGDA